jgi:hypothetical protein
MEAQRLYEAGDYDKTIEILEHVVMTEPLARPLLLECLVRRNKTTPLISFFDPPTNEAEAIHLMDALWAEGRHSRLSELLTMPLIAESMDGSVTEMRRKYALRLSK